MRVRGLLVAGLVGLTITVGASGPDVAPTLRITSPLGRTGLPGAIRIVARLDGADKRPPTKVDFLVDQVLLASDTDGPPYEALWSDDNPFERRELTARAEFADGPPLTDTVVLNPMTVAEAAEVTSVALETSVLTPKGQFVRGLMPSAFHVFENDEEQDLDGVSQKREPALFAVLVDSSQSMALRADGLRAAARRLLDPLAPEDEVVVAPFSRHILSLTGPTTDRRTALDAIAGIRPAGGTAILDALQEAV